MSKKVNKYRFFLTVYTWPQDENFTKYKVLSFDNFAAARREALRYTSVLFRKSGGTPFATVMKGGKLRYRCVASVKHRVEEEYFKQEKKES